jgi:hypothetical protein
MDMRCVIERGIDVVVAPKPNSDTKAEILGDSQTGIGSSSSSQEWLPKKDEDGHWEEQLEN